MGRSRRSSALLAALGLFAAGCTSARGGAVSHSTPARAIAPSSPLSPLSPSSPSSAPHTATQAPTLRPSPSAARRPGTRGRPLPLPFATGNARQVITAVGSSTSSTTGVVQAWRKVPGGWRRAGPAVPAWFGSDGLTRQPSESRSATPIGSFTLTHAFGRLPDPGTALPYVRTTPADWWISQPGPLYNTRQRCSSGCAFTRGDPNEQLYYTVPYYRYAVVIDYNTRNSPTGVVQGAGSAFFLHVSVGAPTQGCISIAQSQLVRLLRWLSPARHPRILIGVQ